MRQWLVFSVTLSLAMCAASGGPTPLDYGFDFVTIGAPNNPAYQGGDKGRLAGRGSVSYEYRISRTEITSAQYMEFLNTFLARWSDDFYGVQYVSYSGFSTAIGGSQAFVLNEHLTDPANVPVHGISWRAAAMYCNWLHNDKQPTLAAVSSGAYDISTFGWTDEFSFTDQPTHSPGAKYWIPTLDEWLKAAHFDPNGYGPGQPRWWNYSNTSDTAPVSGLPGVGETSAGLERGPDYPDWPEYIPLRSYPQTRSPWGLLDLSGGAAEWTEEILYPEFPRNRVADGAPAGGNYYEGYLDRIDRYASSLPSSAAGAASLRIASSVPQPGILAAYCMTCSLCARRRSRNP